MDEEINFLVEGNVSGLEWRPVNGSSWIRVNQMEEGVIGLPLHEHSILPGNHSLWVRVYSPDGVSAPLYILQEVEEARETDGSEDGINAIYYGFPVVIVIALLGVWLVMNQRKQEDDSELDDDPEIELSEEEVF